MHGVTWQDRGTDKARQAAIANEAGLADAVEALLLASVEGDSADARRGVEAAVERIARDAAGEIDKAGEGSRSSLVAQRITADMVIGLNESAKARLTHALRAAASQGLNPRDQAKLVEHLVPLTPRMAQAVVNYRRALKRGTMDALRPALRDKRSDSSVKRGNLSETKIRALTERYAARLRRYRAETIARTEALRAANLSQHETLMAAVRSGRMPPMVKKWLVATDERLCEHCRRIPKMNKGGIPLESSFETPIGAAFLPPLHPNCLPGYALIASGGRITAVSERKYRGELAVITTAAGHECAVTPNHPVLTPHGWIAAGLLRQGDYVLSGDIGKWREHANQQATRIEDVAEAFRLSRGMDATHVPCAAEDFHGDGIGSEVAVVRTHGKLRSHGESGLIETLGKRGLVAACEALEIALHGVCCLDAFVERTLAAFHCAMCGGDLSLALTLGHVAPLDALGVGVSAQRHSIFDEPARDGGPADAMPCRELVHRVAGKVAADEVVLVRRIPFDGHVFNLETVEGFYVAEGIVTHNCRCTVQYSIA